MNDQRPRCGATCEKRHDNRRYVYVRWACRNFVKKPGDHCRWHGGPQ